ncbi:MAG: mannose-6-phosphate isomerase, class I [Spirochaetia bacterium]|nr:mannose-6-phosphate isomerase, class I [Spirochaetia bacterium]
MNSLPWIYRLNCPVQYYDWGNPDPNGIIRSILKMSPDMEAGKPHAELWMGAHHSASATIQPENHSLLESIQDNPEHMLGRNLSGEEITLPFLFKILDASRPLSIQAHPDKRLAEQLHSRDSKNYPDNNHKPELAVCIRNTKILAGFRPWHEIQNFMDTVPELYTLCHIRLKQGGNENELLKHSWEALMTAEKNIIRESVLSFKDRFFSSRNLEEKIVFELIDYYGDEDPGVFCVYFLNYIELKEKEGIFLGPNEPHAYLGGQMLECMASSDNVVRAGLTSKFRDVETLVSMLHYRTERPEMILLSKTSRTGLFHYPVPVSDFSLFQIQLNPETPFEYVPLHLPSILLVFEGALEIQCGSEILKADQGSVFFFPGDLMDRNKKIFLKTLESKSTEHYIASAGS